MDSSSASKQKISTAMDHSKMINEEQHSDLIFQVEKQQVFAHYYVVSIRCPLLVAPKDPKRKPKKKKNITIVDAPPTISHKTLLDVLYYLYTGHIEFSVLNPFQILQLNAAAMELEIERLKWMCENFLRTQMNLDNIYAIYKGCHELNQPYIKDLCLRFIVHNFNQVTGNKDRVKEIGLELFQEAVDFNQKHRPQDLPPVVAPPEPQNTVVADFKKVLETMENSDITFRVNDEFVKAHRAILAAQSTELSNLCSAQVVPKTKEAPEHIVVKGVRTIAKDGTPREGAVISAEAFRWFLKYMYYGEGFIPPLQACELVAFGRDYGLNTLQYTALEVAKRNINKDTVLQIMGITYLPQMAELEATSAELKQKTMDYLISHFEEIPFKSLKKMNPEIGLDILLAHQEREKKNSQRAH